MCEENFNENVMCSDREDKRFFEAVQLLDLINKKILKLISELEKKSKDPRVLKLVEKYNPSLLKEILTTSHHVAYVKDNGDEFSLCLQLENMRASSLILIH